MIGVSAKTSIKKAQKYLRDVQKRDIPAAQKMAVVSAARACKKPVNSAVAARVPIQKMYITRRLFMKSYDKRLEGVMMNFYRRDINAAGPKSKQAKVTVPGLTATGRKKKNHGKVVAIGRAYSNAWPNKGKYNPIILQRNGKSAYPIHVVMIKVGSWSSKISQRIAGRVFPPKFEKEYNRQLKRKVAKRAR